MAPSTSSTISPTRRPLSTRKLDALYFTFFLIHIPIMLLIDLADILPSILVTDVSRSLREYQLDNFQDLFFVRPPTWFTAYMYLEVVYHIPISAWFLWAIPRDHPLVPLHLLIFALETAVTTLTCVADISGWDSHTAQQKRDLYGLYVPYLVLACLMGVDAFFKVKRQILGHSVTGKGKTA